MDAEPRRTTSPCNKLHELPPVATDWQQTTCCPDCDYYEFVTCGNSMRPDRNAVCPFDGQALPLREVAGEPNNDQPQKPRDVTLRKGRESQPRSQGLEQAIARQIVQRTGRRIQMLEVKKVDNVIVIRGRAPCYYVKQLALQAVIDIGSSAASGVEFDLQVQASPANCEGNVHKGVEKHA